MGHIISIACYILTLAFYQKVGPGCSLPEFLDRFQGENMSEMFILWMLNLAQDKLINQENWINCVSKKRLVGGKIMYDFMDSAQEKEQIKQSIEKFYGQLSRK